MVSLQRGLESMGAVPHRGRAGPAEPAQRLRLPRLRVAGGARRPQARRVLRERRQGGRRGGHQARRHAGVLRPALDRRPDGQARVLAVAAGPAHPSDGAAARRRPLPADRLGRRVPADRRRAARARQPERGGVLHLGPYQQRGRVPVSAAGPQLRHQQPARLLEHVPRVVGHCADRRDRHRQGLGHRRRRHQGRSDHHLPGRTPAPTIRACFRRWRRRKPTAPRSSRSTRCRRPG